ncbi:MAG TPA: hypothetical protein VGC72_11715 [Candidatus Elarobacter sp.]|jgi:hypothetical protein
MTSTRRAVDPPPADGERERLIAAVRCGTTPDYVVIRAIVAAAHERDDRLARFTAMGREFVGDVRRTIGSDGAAVLLGAAPNVRECVLESATRQIAAGGGGALPAMQQLSRDVGIPRRTLYNVHSATEIAAACRRRAQTIWRARFERSVLDATPHPVARLFAVFDTLGAWVGSDRFRADQTLCARPSFAQRLQDDDLREHLAEVERFAIALAAAARLASPSAFGAFVATSVAGAAAWYDRCAAAHAASVAFVKCEVARRH